MIPFPQILNWRRLSDRITTSGQPTEAQLAEIKSLGISHVINLAPHHNAGSLEDEAQTVSNLGMTYIHIPVEFDSHTEQDFRSFQTAIDGLRHTKIHVHCIVNARVSAFFYRYAKSGGDMSEADALTNMIGIWRPGNDWAEFLGRQNAPGKSNLFAGKDY